MAIYNEKCKMNPKPLIPFFQTMPRQEVGTKKACPLPYQFEIDAVISNKQLVLIMNNTGSGGAHFVLYNHSYPSRPPRKYTIESHKQITDNLQVSNNHYS